MTDASAVTTSSTATTTIGARPAPGREPLLAVNDLRVEFAARRVVHAVRGLSYTIAPGETLGLVGESGSGKSVSALALLGLLPKRVGRITAGSVRFEGRELVGLPEDQLRHVRGARIAMIFQDPLSSLNPVLTVGRQITEGLETHRGLNHTAGLLQSLPRLDRRRQAELTPIGGAPPDLARQIVGCPFAPRCAWRLDLCWSVDPEMLPASRDANVDARPGPRSAAENALVAG